MPQSRHRSSRFLTDQRPPSAQRPINRSDFYREEFLKHRQCLQRQREYYSERAVTDVEAVLTRILAQIDQLCTKEDADQVVSRLLRKFDVVTNLSAWSDPKNTH